MAINRGSITALTAPDVHRVFLERREDIPQEYLSFMNSGQMPWNPITDQQVVGIGAMPAKPEGSVFTPTEHQMGGTVTATAVPYGQALEFTKEGWRDELYGTLVELVGEMTLAARERMNIDAFRPINDAFAGATFTGFDGVALASTSHTDPDGSTRSNRLSPDIGFSHTAVQEIMRLFHANVTPRGSTRPIRPRGFIIDYFNAHRAREVLGSTMKSGTANNEINALVMDDVTFQIVHYLTTNTHFHCFGDKRNHDVWFYVRDDTEFDAFDDPWSGNAVYTTYQRHVPYFGSFRGWAASTG